MHAPRLQRALSAGLRALLAFLLTSALFATPVLAAEHDFGHTHPEGTPPHVHTVDAVLGVATLCAPAVVPFVLYQSDAPPTHLTPRAAAPLRLRSCSRAPPGQLP
ncbi:hypothetical protein [Truepera radiovictrix]|uniref:Uncharacterized protein n=1 Tax=Truepera radiovictrix (strain DSM 17093 / CIP 108686 / LMG 22925 / RQ-24) TaxID=649638 RepID=D7CUM1_TRURR|nr:hypothetical protein [Truepera radiovictrix]ADI14012.1 hypothetical protein Trad_0878 [Truepera radiovictrix DSM 17093]WMT57428.1 hypothetical protein RCV51_00430 [Truepera radiovictrix]